MSNTIKKVEETTAEALLELYTELETRYGPAMAQQIIDQIKKVENKDYIPEYIDVRLVSDVLEQFAAETAQISSDDVIELSMVKQEQYKALIQEVFNALYNRFMAAYVSTPSDLYKSPFYKQKTKMAA